MKRELKIGNKDFASVEGVRKGDCVGNNYYNHTATETYITLGHNHKLSLKEASILATEILKEVKRLKTDENNL